MLQRHALRWMVSTAATFVLAGTPAPAFAGSIPITFETVREGTSPAMSATEFETSRQLVLKELTTFRSQFITSILDTVKSDARCRRYAIATQKTLFQMRQALAGFTSNGALDQLNDAEFQSRMRFELLHYSALNLYQLFRGEKERDYSSLDESANLKCDFKDRAALTQGYDRLIRDTNVLRILGFGAMGIKTLDRATDRWIKIAQDIAADRNRKSKALAVFDAATIALSFGTLFGVVAMPLVIERIPFIIEEVLGRFVLRGAVAIPPGALVKPIDYGLVAADIGGNYYLNGRLQPEEDKRESNYGLRWEDKMTQVEMLVNSPESYAMLGLAYFSEVKSETARIFRDYLFDNSGALKKAHGADLEETLALADESLYIDPHPIKDQILRLEQILNEHYGYQMSCRSGSYKDLYLNSVTDLDCYAALRRFARVVYATKLPALSSDGRSVLAFEFDNDESTFDERQEPFVVRLHSGASPEKLQSFVYNVVHHPAVRQRLLDNQRFANLANNFSLNTGIILSSDNTLNLTERWRALANLSTIVEATPELLHLNIDEIRLQPNFSSLDDRGLKLRLGIAANASVEQIQQFLKAEAVNPRRSERIATFFREYDHAQALIEQIRARGFEAKCSSAGELTLASCIKTLVVVDDILAKSSPKYLHAVEISSIMVLGQDEMPQAATTMVRMQNSEMWNVREETKPFELALYLRQHGWIHSLVRADAAAGAHGAFKPERLFGDERH